MFSRKRITRSLASVLIMLMLMAVIPFTAGAKVLASGVDKDNAEKISVHDSSEIPAKKESKTFLLHTTGSMKYRFDLAQAYEDIVYCHDLVAMISVYDASEKLVASSDKKDLTVELKGDADYYIVIDKNAYWCQLQCEYDYRLDYTVKTKADSSFRQVSSYSKWGAGIYDDKLWPHLGVNDSTDLKVDLAINSLPSGMKLNYEWSWDQTNNNKFVSIGSANKTLDIKDPAGSKKIYKCSIKSTDGKFSDYILFRVETTPTYAFKDGSDWACDAHAYKPGEERKIVFPENYYTGDPNETASYFFEEYFIANYKYSGGGKLISAIPDDWYGTAIFSSAYKGNARLKYLSLSFVFADGAGKAAKSGNTYHIDSSSFEKDHAQVIYSFTPEKTGTYKFSTSNVKFGYSIGTIFDQDRKVVATSLNDFVKGTADGVEPRTFEIQAELTAGKTYYIAIPMVLVSLECDLSISGVITTPTAAPSTPTTAPTSALEGLSFGDFVERLYVVALGRQSEPEGKAFWCEHVGNGDLTGAACANEFLLSKEFNDRKLSDEEFLKVLYKTFFDRDAANDPDGFNFWMNSLKTEGRDKVVDGFINSTEWCNICASYGVKSGATRAKATIASANATAFATRLYTECLGRDAEEEGLKFWSLGLTNQELSGTQAAKEFFYSPEFVNAKYSNEEYINRMYKTFMGRDPEAEGKAYWLDLLSKGTSRDEVFNFFSTCPEFTEICQKYAITR